MKKLLLYTLFACSAFFGNCKRKSTPPTPQDLLSAHIWIGVNIDYAITTSGLPFDARVSPTDSTAIEFKRDGTLIFYNRNPSTGQITEANRQKYTLSADSKTIEIIGVEALLGPTLQAQIQTFGIKLPTTIGVQKLTTDALELKGSFQQNILVPNFPIPVALVANYLLTYRK